MVIKQCWSWAETDGCVELDWFIALQRPSMLELCKKISFLVKTHYHWPFSTFLSCDGLWKLRNKWHDYICHDNPENMVAMPKLVLTQTLTHFSQQLLRQALRLLEIGMFVVEKHGTGASMLGVIKRQHKASNSKNHLQEWEHQSGIDCMKQKLSSLSVWRFPLTDDRLCTISLDLVPFHSWESTGLMNKLAHASDASNLRNFKETTSKAMQRTSQGWVHSDHSAKPGKKKKHMYMYIIIVYMYVYIYIL